MNENEKIPKLSLSDWDVASLRLTTFSSKLLRDSQTTWWNDITGQKSDNVIEQPKQGMRQEIGNFGQGNLIMTLRPDRIDFLYTIIATPQFEAATPTVGKFTDALEVFLTAMFHWLSLETCPAIERIAFGAILIHSATTLQDSYKKLLAFLPEIKIDFEGSRDFLFQINRPRKTKTTIPGLEINRLSKWSIFNLFEVFRKILPNTSSEKLDIPSPFVCRVELDINTSDDFKNDLPKEYLPDLLKELVDLGQEIVENGDIQ